MVKKMIEIKVSKMKLSSQTHREYPVIPLIEKRSLGKTQPEILIPVTVKLPASMLNKIHMICNRYKIQRSKLIRKAINEFLEKFDEV
jgi:hypothetical protein